MCVCSWFFRCTVVEEFVVEGARAQNGFNYIWVFGRFTVLIKVQSHAMHILICIGTAIVVTLVEKYMQS